MPGPMSRPDGVRETRLDRKVRGLRILNGKIVWSGKTDHNKNK
ncbi:hypothetical protein SEA_TUNATARTARE_121 [Streptomyces phage TunaTartare]|uniref:Uncharacterized protein n=1 Tax=Streptomyces phage TunaTartare TaxID=2848887 RepID=A0A8F2E728_9CAUD|nr:hypothetical protein PP457_gp141 [Streptomyces phage TunaTartare]QWT30001.1 hypothetical protein SEA_TUNATARTARE_121 [Streptomyces phage TunaTartare]